MVLSLKYSHIVFGFSRTSKTKRSVSVNSTVYNSLSNELTQGSKEVLNNPSDKDELGDTATKKKNSSRSSH